MFGSYAYWNGFSDLRDPERVGSLSRTIRQISLERQVCIFSVHRGKGFPLRDCLLC